MARTITISQLSTNNKPIAVTLDGTKDFTVHPTEDLKLTVKQDGHPDMVFPKSFPLTVSYKGEWPVTPPPPTGNLNMDLSYIDRASQKYRDFLGQCDRDDAVVQDLIIGYKLSGVDSYRMRAVAMTDAWVAAANTAINAGRDPALAGDSFLYADNDFITPMAFVYAWGNPTAAQKSAWAAIANQTVFNIWNPQQAHWGNRLSTWSGWAVNDPHNNYHLHFMRLSAAWALACNDSAQLTAMGPRWADEVAAMASISGGGDLEGTGYGYAMAVLFDAYRIWRDSGQTNFANANSHLANTIRSWVHGTVPTLDRFAPIGDQARVSEPVIYDYQRGLVMLANYLATDPVAKAEANYWLSNITHQHEDIYRQNYFDDLYPYANSSTPPSTKVFRSPEVGSVFARTSWAADATWLYVMMGKYDQSHAHQEQGGFTLFGKGNWLAVTNNIWSHSGIEQQTRDKNVIRFHRGNTIIPQVSGHQAIVNVSNYTQNDLTGEMHIVGQMRALYTDPGVVGWTRTIDFVNGITTITDFCAVNGVTATFQLNVPQRPTIAGNVITCGKLKATVITPANCTISVVDMTTITGDRIATKQNEASIQNAREKQKAITLGHAKAAPQGASDYNGGFRVDIDGSTNYKVQLEVLP